MKETTQPNLGKVLTYLILKTNFSVLNFDFSHPHISENSNSQI